MSGCVRMPGPRASRQVLRERLERALTEIDRLQQERARVQRGLGAALLRSRQVEGTERLEVLLQAVRDGLYFQGEQ